MESPTTSLSDQLAGLCTTLTAGEAPCWMPDRVHALIIACLARIFARLENVLTLWQAGQLPPLPPRPASTAPRTQNPRAPGPRQTTSHRAKPSTCAATQPSAAQPDRHRCPRKPARSFVRAISTPGIASTIGGRAVPRRHLARAPPVCGLTSIEIPQKGGGEAMSNSFRYKNNNNQLIRTLSYRQGPGAWPLAGLGRAQPFALNPSEPWAAKPAPTTIPSTAPAALRLAPPSSGLRLVGSAGTG